MSNEASPVNEEAVGTEEAVPAEEQRAETSVKKGGLAVGLVIVLSLTWYLLADRFTPYTSQARVQASWFSSSNRCPTPSRARSLQMTP